MKSSLQSDGGGKKLKILMVCGALPPDKCGVGDYTHKLANSLVGMGVDVTMLTTKGRTPADANYSIKDIIEKWSDFTTLKTIKNILINENYEIVHFQNPFSNLKRESIINSVFLPMVLKKYSKTLIYTYHEYSGRGWKRAIRKIEGRNSIKCADAVIVAEPIFKKEMGKIRPEESIYFSQVHASIKKCDLTLDELKHIREKINKGSESKSIMVFFGFVASNKKMDIILDAMGILKKEGRLDSILLVCTSVDDKNEYHKYFLERIKELELEEDVVITGYMKADEVSKYIMASDFGLLLYEEGISPRHSAALAVLKQGIRLITTRPQDGNEFSYSELPKEQIIFVENDSTCLAKTILAEQSKRIHFDVDDIVFSPLATAKRHMDIYSEVLRMKDN